MTIRRYTRTTNDNVFLNELRGRIDPADVLSAVTLGELSALSVDFTNNTGRAAADLDQVLAEDGYEPLGDFPPLIDGAHYWGRFTTADEPLLAISAEGDTGYNLDLQAEVVFDGASWQPSSVNALAPYGTAGNIQNVIRFSEQMDAAPWEQPGSIVTITPDNATAPNGEQTVDTVQWDSVGLGLRQATPGVKDSTVYTVSFWGESISGNDVIDIALNGGTPTALLLSPGLKRLQVIVTSGVGTPEITLTVSVMVGTFNMWGWSVTEGADQQPYLKTANIPMDIERPGTAVNTDLIASGGISQLVTGNPTIAGFFDQGGVLNFPGFVTVVNDYAYVNNAGGPAEIAILDVSDPKNIQHVSTISMVVATSALIIRANYLYTVAPASDTVVVVDVADKTNPVIVGSGASVGHIQEFDVRGQYLYAGANNSNNLEIANISDPFSPIFLNEIDLTPHFCTAPKIFGRYLYIASLSTDTLLIYDLADPVNPVQVGILTDAVNLDNFNDIQVTEKYVYGIIGAGGGRGIVIIDVRDPTTPVIAGTVTDSVNISGALGISISGTTVYLTSQSTSKLAIIDVSDPTNPVISSFLSDASFLMFPGPPYISGAYLYIPNFLNNALTVLDLKGSRLGSTHTSNASFGYMETIGDGRIGGRCDVGGPITGGGDILSLEAIVGRTLSERRIAFAATANTTALGIGGMYAYTATGAAVTLTISTFTIELGSPSQPHEFTIKDEGGGASIDNINIDTEGAATIDGVASTSISADYGVIRFYADGTNVWTKAN